MILNYETKQVIRIFRQAWSELEQDLMGLYAQSSNAIEFAGSLGAYVDGLMEGGFWIPGVDASSVHRVDVGFLAEWVIEAISVESNDFGIFYLKGNA